MSRMRRVATRRAGLRARWISASAMGRTLELIGGVFRLLNAHPWLALFPALWTLLQLALAAVLNRDPLLTAGFVRVVGNSRDWVVYGHDLTRFVAIGMPFLESCLRSLFLAAFLIAALETLRREVVSFIGIWRTVLSRGGSLLAWAALTAIVPVFAAIHDGGKAWTIALVLIALAWHLLTYFVVPVMVFESAGLLQGVRRSLALFRATWRELAIFTGLFIAVALALVIPLVWWLDSHGVQVMAPEGGARTLLQVGTMAASVLFTCAMGGFCAVLYGYAITDMSPGELVAAPARKTRSRSR